MYLNRPARTPVTKKGADKQKLYSEKEQPETQNKLLLDKQMLETECLNNENNIQNNYEKENTTRTILCDTIFIESEDEKEETKKKMPMIQGEIENILCMILIDTGCQISCVSKDFYEEIIQKNKNIMKLPVTGVKIIGATGGKSKNIQHQIYINMKINNLEFNIVALVVENLVYKAIIGADWLDEIEGKIDFSKKILNIQDKSIPFAQITEEQTQINMMAVSQDEPKQIREITKNNDTKLPNFTINSLNKEFADIFTDIPGRTKIYTHKIRLVDEQPFKPRTYPIPIYQKEAVRKKIKEMLKWGIIRRSETPYISPIVPIMKKDGTVRICLDAQSLNKKIEMDYECPQPAEQLLYQYSTKVYFSTLDLTSSFWQIGLTEESTKYCGFLFDNQVYEFLVMPFGLKTAVAGMSRCINLIFQECSDFVSCYIDDILITSPSEQKHYEHLKIVLQKLREANLTVNLAKCNFFRKEIPFLGHILTVDGIKIDSSKIDSLQKYPRPTNIRNLRGFIGICNYHRRFCQNYTETLQPLYDLLKKGKKWHWNNEHEEAFTTAKKGIIEACQLYHPDLAKEFQMETDASAIAVAGRLFQIKDNKQQTIAFYSRKLTAAEINYFTCERELLAIISCLLKWKTIVMGSKIVIWCDHKSLSFLLNCQLLNPRLTRWYLKIQNFNFEIRHVPGKENIIADALSRYPYEMDSNKKEVIVANTKLINDKKVIASLTKLKELQTSDFILNSIREKLLSDNNDVQNQYMIHKEILFHHNLKTKTWKACIPQSIQSDIIKAYHEELGHFGVWKTYKALNHCYYWKNMRETVKKIVKSCELCQKSKYPTQATIGKMKSIIPKNDNDLLAVDIFGPLPTSVAGVKYIFVILNVYTKYIKLYPIKRPTASTLVNRLEKDYFPNVRKPNSILSDNGTQFVSRKWNDFLYKNDIRNLHCSIRHPQSNPSERSMREIARLLRIYCHDKHTAWARYVKKVEFLINCAVHESTEAAPIFLEKGISPDDEVKKLLEFPENEENINYNLQLVRDKLLTKARRRQTKHDKNKKFTEFSVGDLVWLKSNHMSSAEDRETKKLFLLFEGPYRIKSIAGHNAYALESPRDGTVRGTFNVISLKPYAA